MRLQEETGWSSKLTISLPLFSDRSRAGQLVLYKTMPLLRCSVIFLFFYMESLSYPIFPISVDLWPVSRTTRRYTGIKLIQYVKYTDKRFMVLEIKDVQLGTGSETTL